MKKRINPDTGILIASEADTQRAISDYLGYSGWLVIQTSQPWRAATGLVGCPDLIAFRFFGGGERTGVSGMTVTLLVECKARRGKLRRSQEEFYVRVKEHLSPTLIYCVARSIEDVATLIGGVK